MISVSIPILVAFLIVSQTQICDARKDCVGGEDEKDCADTARVEVRLVNGSSPHEGRVEVKGTV